MRLPRFRWYLAILTLSSLVVAAPGCSGSAGAEVTGTVRFEGQPLQGGKITFYHPRQPGRNVSAYIQPDGTYRILEVPYGQVKVTIVALPPKKKDRTGKGASKLALPPIPLKYSDPETTDLVCPVRHATQTFDIDLKS